MSAVLFRIEQEDRKETQKSGKRICLFRNCSYICEQMADVRNHTDREVRLARFARAMGHPTRIAILRFLAAQESCFFGAIHEVLPVAKATVSQHLKELKEAGLIQGEIMPPKVKYCIHRGNWEEARRLFADLFGEAVPKNDDCCGLR